MPRRRRKVSGNRLRPLIFIESPVNIVHKLQSPVFSSDNPATADVVPVDGNATWVSPQFIKVPPTCTQPRRTRRTTRSAIGDQLLHGSRNQRQVNVTLPNPPISSKYKPLAFVGYDEDDEDDDVTSICEDISVEDDRTINVVRQNDVSAAKPNGILSIVNDDIRECVGKTISAQASQHIPEKSVHSNMETDILVEGINGHADDQTELQLGNCDINTPELSPLRLVSNVTEAKSSNTKYTSIKSKRSSEELDGTQHRPQINEKKGKLYRRLFSTEVRNQDRESGSDCDFDSIPRRRSNRIKRMKENFFPNSQLHTPIDQMKENFQVLVYDTPEEDYGMSVRHRRLRDKVTKDRGIKR